MLSTPTAARFIPPRRDNLARSLRENNRRTSPASGFLASFHCGRKPDRPPLRLPSLHSFLALRANVVLTDDERNEARKFLRSADASLSAQGGKNLRFAHARQVFTPLKGGRSGCARRGVSPAARKRAARASKNPIARGHPYLYLHYFHTLYILYHSLFLAQSRAFLPYAPSVFRPVFITRGDYRRHARANLHLGVCLKIPGGRVQEGGDGQRTTR
jgi:hypothetical protein